VKTKYSPLLAPKTHQSESLDVMLFDNLANFDDQGLGKCKQAYDLAGHLLAVKKIDLMVVVSKASLKENFLAELSKDAHQLIGKFVEGTKLERRRIYRYPSYHVLIVSYDHVIRDAHALAELLKKNKVLLCLDEAHYIKNPNARRTKACLELSRFAFKTAIFTGTPIPNRLEDIYTQLKFLGNNVGNSVEEFKDRFGDVAQFREFLHTRMIRRRKESLKELNLPGKKFRYVDVNLSAEERSVYNKLRDDMILEIRNKHGAATSIPVQNILAQLLRLTQVTSNLGLLNSGYDGERAKLAALDQQVKALVEDKREKLIIWTNYRHNVRLLQKQYAHLGAVTIYGEMSKDDIQRAGHRFKTDERVKVLIAIPACAREGFTFTVSCKAIYLDRNFSLLDWLQSQDRIHRISQTRECEIIVLRARDTIDERIDEVLGRKDHLQRFLLGDEDKYLGREKLTVKDIEKLLS
jgi:SNF2 family DNA or RNA helicase